MNLQNISFYLAIPPAWLAALLAGLLALTAWRMRWLNMSGAVSTFVIGFLIFWLGGVKAIVPLLTFFLSSSILSKVSKKLAETRSPQQKTVVSNPTTNAPDNSAEISPKTSDLYTAKGSTRDAGQVWANGGVALAIVLLHRLLVWRGIPPYQVEQLPTLFLAALATVNADTWATELGRLSGQTPRSLRDGKPVSSGTSGAISPVGTLAALAGAVIVPLSVYMLWPLNVVQFTCVVWAGFLGSLIDSLLGAGLQAQYRDLQSGTLTERMEVEGRPTKRIRGLSWMNNDVVNFFASFGGVCCAYYLLHYSHLM